MTSFSEASARKYTVTSTFSVICLSVASNAAPNITTLASTKSVMVMMRTAASETKPFLINPIRPYRAMRFALTQLLIECICPFYHLARRDLDPLSQRDALRNRRHYCCASQGERSCQDRLSFSGSQRRHLYLSGPVCLSPRPLLTHRAAFRWRAR